VQKAQVFMAGLDKTYKEHVQQDCISHLLNASVAQVLRSNSQSHGSPDGIVMCCHASRLKGPKHTKQEEEVHLQASHELLMLRLLLLVLTQPLHEVLTHLSQQARLVSLQHALPLGNA